MKKFRTVAAVVIMFFAAMAGYFVGAALQEEMGGAILFAVITGFACVIYNMDNRESSWRCLTGRKVKIWKIRLV